MSAKNILSNIFLIVLISLSISACSLHEKPETIYGSAWPFYQGDLNHRGYVKGEVKPRFSSKWIKQLEEDVRTPYASQETSSPAAGENTIYCGSVTGRGLQALNYKNGDTIWRFNLEKGIEGSPALFEGMVYFGSNDGYIYAVKAENGDLVWSFNAEAEILSSPVAAEGILFFSSSVDSVYALDAITGKLLWKYGKYEKNTYSIRGASSPVYNNGVLYIGLTNGTITALGAFDGSTIWEKKLSTTKGLKFYDIDSSPTVDDKTLYIASVDAGFFALDISDGDILWKYAAKGVTSPAYDDQNLYFSDNSGKVIGLEKITELYCGNSHLKTGLPHLL